MVVPAEFSHVGLRSDHVDDTVEFLRTHVDAELQDRGQIERDDWDQVVEYAALGLADKSVFVVDPTPYEAAGLVDSIPSGIAHYGIVVDDVYAALADWRGADGSVLMEPFVLGDVRYAFCHGPDGTRIELVEHVESSST